MKTNEQILEFIGIHPGHTAEIDVLRQFIGENADRRLSGMVHDEQLSCDSHWFNNAPATYTLTGKGEARLADYLLELRRRRWENIRYAITTLIAFVALGVSIAAYLK